MGEEGRRGGGEEGTEKDEKKIGERLSKGKEGGEAGRSKRSGEGRGK